MCDDVKFLGNDENEKISNFLTEDLGRIENYQNIKRGSPLREKNL